MTDSPTTATEMTRQALRNFNRKANLASMAQDLKVPTDKLEGFAENRIARLPDELMKKLVERIWHGHQTFNAEHDALESVNKTSVPAYTVMPDPVKVSDNKVWTNEVLRATPMPGMHSEQPPPKRKGWLGGWL